MIRSRGDLPTPVVKPSFHFVAPSSKVMCRIGSATLGSGVRAVVGIVSSFAVVSKVYIGRRYRWRPALAVELPGGWIATALHSF